jgi:hypothetical protein
MPGKKLSLAVGLLLILAILAKLSGFSLTSVMEGVTMVLSL